MSLVDYYANLGTKIDIAPLLAFILVIFSFAYLVIDETFNEENHNE